MTMFASDDLIYLSSRIPGLDRHTPAIDRLPNTLMVSFPATLRRHVLSCAPRIAASTGSAGHAGRDTPGETLLAMGVPPDVALGAVRLSLGHDNSSADIAAAVDILTRAHRSATTDSAT